MIRFLYLAAIPSLLVFQTVQAATSCSINKSSGDGRYESFVDDIVLEDSTESDDTKIVYIKPDGKVVRLTYGQVKSKTDWSDLDKSVFVTFKSMPTASLEVGYGDVDVSRQDIRKLHALADAEKKLVLWMEDTYVAFCMPKGSPPPAMVSPH